MDNIFSIQEVASKLNLSDKTLRRWEEAGRFSPSRTLGNQRRYSLEDLQILDALKHGTIARQSDLLSLEQAAEFSGVAPATILRWENEGKIHPFITAGNTYYPRQRLHAVVEDTEPPTPPTPAQLNPPPLLNHPTLQEPVVRTIATIPASTKSTMHLALINAIFTVVILSCYHLLFQSQKSEISSPQSGSVQGMTTIDPRFDILEEKLQDHLKNELNNQATQTPTTAITIGRAELIAGESTLLKGQSQVLVMNDRLTADALISITFTQDYAPAKKYWIEPNQGSFTLHTDFPMGTNTTFQYQAVISLPEEP